MDLGNTLQSFAVLQRNKDNVSAHPFSGRCKNSGKVLLTVKTSNGRIVDGFDKITVGNADRGRVKGVINALPVGGAYKITLQIAGSNEKAVFHDVLVGDLWLLAGQSNMADSGVLPSLSEPDPMVHAYYMVNKWGIAQAPLHDTGRAVAPVHGGSPECLPKTVSGRGAGPGLEFALEMYKATNIPQGVIACAHGGTTLAQWDPGLKKLGGNSLYGAMYERLQDLGGKAAGFLWYQGCSDTGREEQVRQYLANTRKVFNSIRRDCRNPQLPIVFVQLAAFIADSSYPNPSSYWLRVRNSQYLLGQKYLNTVCVPAIDLELADQIHLSNRGVKILGKRMADAMQYLCKIGNHLPPIKVKKINYTRAYATGNTKVTVFFENICGELSSGSSLPSGFGLVDNSNNFISEAISCRLQGCSVEVELKIPYTFFNENFKIAYGGNFQPHANIIDGAGRSLPCFAVSGRKQQANLTGFVSEALVSNAVYGSEALEELNLPNAEELKQITFTRAAFSPIYLLCPAPEAGHSKFEPRKYYYKFYLELPEAMELKMLFGSDAAFAVYCNGKELMRKYTVNPVVLDEFSCPVSLKAGKHEFFVVFSANSGRGWGYCCRFLRKDGKKIPKLLPVGTNS